MNDIQADEMLTNIKELQADKERFDKIAKAKWGDIEANLLRKTMVIDDEIQFMKDQLAAFFLTVPTKETKTQHSYSLLSGKLVMKKATQKIAHDDEKLMKWISENAQQYGRTTFTNKVAWDTLKKDLIITSGIIMNKVTGEVLHDIGLTIEEVAPQFDIK